MKALAYNFVFTILLVSVALYGCSGENYEDSMASAKNYLEKNENKSAIIQLKTALQAKSDAPEARFLLAKLLLDSGDATSATVELRKALDLKYPDAIVIPVLAKSLIAEGQQQKLVDQYSGTDLADPVPHADLKTSIAIAFATLGESDQASLALDDALNKQPEYVPALIVQARFMAGKGDFEGALGLVEKILVKAPDNYEAWQLKGALLGRSRADTDDAVSAYRKALSFKNDDVGSHVGIASIYLLQRDTKSAAAQIEELEKVRPNHPRTKFLQARLAVQQGDFKAARELLQRVLSVVSGDPTVLQLAGAVELQLRSYLQADKFLSKALQLSPDLRAARLLLAQTYLQSGQPAKALTVLRPIVETAEPVPQGLALAAEAYLRSGDNDKADKYFARAAKLNPQDLKSRTALALRQFSKGNAEKALGELEAIASSDSVTYADLALINLHLQRKEFDNALKAISQLEGKQPDRPFAAYLRGRVKLAQGETSVARQSFERALAIDPVYFPAAATLAALDLAEKKPDLASKRFEDLLRVDPKNLQALLAIAALRERAGASSDEVTGLITNAVKLNPDEVSPRLRLIDHYLKHKEAKTAQVAAQGAVAALPDSPELLAALGRAQMAAGDLNQAISSFSKLAGMQPQSPQPHLSLADVYVARKDNDSAIKSLKQALEITPDLLTAQQALIALEMVAKRPQEALAIARTVQKQRPDDAIGFLLEGKTEVLLKNFDAAVTAFSAGIKKKNVTTELATWLHGALSRVQKQSEADDFAAQWMKDHANDDGFLAYLGDLAFSQRKYALAEDRYLDVLRLKADHVETLSKLADVLTALKKPGAVGYAKKAYELRPDEPKLLAALGRAQASAGDLSKAIETYTKLAAMQPQSPQAHLGLAEVYMARKDSSSAVKSLRRALDISPDLLIAQRALIAVELDAKRPRQALAVARTIQKQRPEDATGFALEAGVESSQKNFDAAVAAFRAALDKKNASPQLARALHTALIAAQKPTEAGVFAAQWVENHSDDDGFLAYLGDIALSKGEYALAETHYLGVLRRKPEHVAVLNNLAYVLTALKKPGAVDYAQKAHDLQPNQPAVMDTLAMALAKESKLDKALAVQKKAVELQPENQGLRMNLAKIYIQAGEKALARGELERLAKAGEKFSQQAEVQKLLDTL
ncbi:MAG: PEP-CTERM system TPR-repeat protein PrsT [Burkholderiaceae bacterium]|nr:PEP-CTERM system TPR-repeat protein PrsT [Burkholderiaceae bacterium]